MILEYKLFLNEVDIIIYLFSLSVKIITNYQSELFAPTEISIISLNLTITETFKISIRIKGLWICPLVN